MGIWRSSTRALMVLNSLVQGKCSTTTENRRSQAFLVGGPPSEAQLALARRTASESARLVRRRGDPGPIGVQALAKLVRSSLLDICGASSKKTKHAEMVASLIDEPTTLKVVALLEALPWDEAELYLRQETLVIKGSRPPV